MRTASAAFLLLAVAGSAFLAGRSTAKPTRDAVAPPGAVAPAAPAPPASTPAEMQGSVAPLVDKVKGAVVTIFSTQTRRVRVDDPWMQFFGRGTQVREQRIEGLGSGFIVDRSGIVLTNNHVVAGADDVVIRLADDRKVKARVLGSDPATDVAVVKMETPPASLPVAALGDSDRVRVGDYVLAIGNPLGLGQTVTMGIVSAKNRQLGDKFDLGEMDKRYQDFIQTDAAINQGNSGGPLYNFRGEVIGINSAILNPGKAMNVGFAIPINLARQIADQLRQTGKVARGFLGVSSADLTAELADELRVSFAPGAVVSGVVPGSPAAQAGLRPKDVIVDMAGRPVDGQRRLSQAVAAFKPGEKVKVGFLREGRKMETLATLGGQAAGGDELFHGIRARALDERETRTYGLPRGVGALVVAVDPRGGASGTIEEGDILIEINGRGASFADFGGLADVLKRGGYYRAVVTVQRGRDRFQVQVSG